MMHTCDACGEFEYISNYDCLKRLYSNPPNTNPNPNANPNPNPNPTPNPALTYPKATRNPTPNPN